MRNKDARFSVDTRFAATGAQRAAMHGHFEPVWPSRFEHACTKQDYGPRRAARSCPAGVTAPPGTDAPRGRAGKSPLCLEEGRKGFPRDSPVSFARTSKNTLLGFAEERHLVTEETTKAIQDNGSSQCKSHSGCREQAREMRLRVPCLPMSPPHKLPGQEQLLGYKMFRKP